jgi:hypothetical protein
MADGVVSTGRRVRRWRTASEAGDSAADVKTRCQRRRGGTSARYKREPAVQVETCLRAWRTERAERRADSRDRKGEHPRHELGVPNGLANFGWSALAQSMIEVV